MVEKTFNQKAGPENKRQKDQSSNDLFLILAIFHQRQEELAQAEQSSRDAQIKQDELAGIKDKYANDLREIYGIENPDDIDKIAQKFLEIDQKIDGEWISLVKSTAQIDAEKTRLKIAFLNDPANGYGEAIRQAQKNLETEDVLDDSGQPVVDAVTHRAKRRFVSAPATIISNSRELAEGRAIVIKTLPDACRIAGVNINLMRGMWGVESTFGAARKSPTGCTGDWQFTRSTFASMMKIYGGQIEDALRDQGLTNELKMVQDYRAGNYEGEDLRNNSIISTYASAFYIHHIADIELKGQNISAMDKESFGIIYASYNIGSGNAKKLLGSLANTENAGGSLGYVAAVNGMFYTGGATGREALQNYQMAVERRLEQYNKSFDPNFVATATPTVKAFSNASLALTAAPSFSPAFTTPSHALHSIFNPITQFSLTGTSTLTAPRNTGSNVDFSNPLALNILSPAKSNFPFGNNSLN